MPGIAYPQALRTHILRLFSPDTILYKAFGLLLSLRVKEPSFPNLILASAQEALAEQTR